MPGDDRSPPGVSLRQHAARGTLINAVFRVGIAVLSLVQRIVVAIFLTPAELGVWSVVLITLMTLFFIKNAGIGDKFVQQTEDDQGAAFRKAFSFELAVTFGFVGVAVVALPVFALAYGKPQILAPGLALTLVTLGNSLQAPTWIFYRRMNFVRQRFLEGIDPLLTFVVTVALAAAGAGYWSLVVGAVVGSWSAGIAALVACPVRLGFELDRSTVLSYFAFSWPLVAARASGLLVAQGTMLVGAHVVGLAGVGAIGLAVSITAFSDGVDAVLTQSLYPAICAVRDRVDLLRETFVKSNRLALMWGMPFGIGVALFASDLVHFLLGDRWQPAVIVLIASGLSAGFDQLGFNWTAYLRACDQTRPLAIVGLVMALTFATITVPLLIVAGIPGYAVGTMISAAVVLVVRTLYLSRLFSGFKMIGHAARAMAPSIPPVAIVLGLRLVEPDRTLAMAAAEFVLYLAATVVLTFALERPLLHEAMGYVRRRPALTVAPTAS